MEGQSFRPPRWQSVIFGIALFVMALAFSVGVASCVVWLEGPPGPPFEETCRNQGGQLIIGPNGPQQCLLPGEPNAG